MTVEEQAEQCRRDIDMSLRSVHKLTSDPLSAAELLLHGVNDVLRAAVDSNFGATCCDAIGVLYDIIDREPLSKMVRCEDMPLLLFARSFAVVIEEAVRQLQQLRQVNTVSFRCGAPEEKKQIVKKEETKVQKSTFDMMAENTLKKEKKEEETESTLSTPAGVATAAVATTMPVAVVRTPQQQKLPVAAAPPARAMQLPHPKRSDKVLDFSPEAIEGRISVYDIPRCVPAEEIRTLLRPFEQCCCGCSGDSSQWQ